MANRASPVASFADRFNATFGRHFHRYVNDRDIVPRVPPGYQHVGDLIQFDDDGAIVEIDVDHLEAFAATEEYRELTDIEFEDLLPLFEAIPKDSGACDPYPGPTPSALEGLLPDLGIIEGIRDHSMIEGYIPALLKNLENNGNPTEKSTGLA